MESFLIAVGTFVPMLLILVVVHEMGHFLTARALGVKALEFGIGFPPRAFGIYTGKTRVLVDQDTSFVNVTGLGDLKPGQFIKVGSIEDRNGQLVARRIEVPEPPRSFKERFSSQESPEEEGILKHDGKVREVSHDSIILADMIYSLNWTPLGGFVRLAGESNPAVPRSLASKGVGTRTLVLVAGPLMNAILPIIILASVAMIPREVPVDKVPVGDVNVVAVAPDSPAEAAGIRAGDIIVEAGGQVIQNQEGLQRAIKLNLDSEMEWVTQREGSQRSIRLAPRSNPPDGQGSAGVRIDLINFPTERRSAPPWVAIPQGFTDTWQLLGLLKQEVSGWIVEGRTPELSGPIGIAQVTGEVTREGGLSGWLVLAVVFSINLAILNILPIPMLDGGRLVFVIIEWVRRGKRVPPDKEGLVHLIGFVVLIGLIILISANDINRLIQGGSPLGGG